MNNLKQDKIIRISTIASSLNILLKGQLKFMNQYFEVLGISSKGKALNEVRERECIRTIEVDMERGISLFKDLQSLIKLYIQFKKEKPLMIHSITPKAGLLSMLAGKLAGVPIRMHTFTGLIFPTKKGKIQKLLIKMDQLLCWASTNIYPEGNGVKKDLIKFKITSKPLKVIANGNLNGIDLEYFSNEQVSLKKKNDLKQELKISESDFVFIFVGRLVGDKGINELVSVFSKLKNKNLKLLLVGQLETELDPLLSKTLIEIDKNDNIISVGFQNDVRPYFTIANCLVFPSYREGFPNVVIQAGALGLPCIVTNINGCNEIIIENVNGIIVPVKNEEMLMDQMIKIFTDNEFYQKLKENARPMIVERYEKSLVWNAMLEEYNLLIKNYKNV